MLNNTQIFGSRLGPGLSPNVPKRTGGVQPPKLGAWGIRRVAFFEPRSFGDSWDGFLEGGRNRSCKQEPVWLVWRQFEDSMGL